MPVGQGGVEWPQRRQSLGRHCRQQGVPRSGGFEESQSCQVSLSQAKEVSRLSSAGSAGHHSDVGRDYFADLRDGGSCMLGKSGPIPSCCIVIFRKVFTSSCSSHLTKKEQFFFLQTKVNVA